EPTAAALWEKAALAAATNGDYPTAVQDTERARDLYTQRGDSRAAARAQATAGQALRRWGRHAQAREQLTAAVEVLRADPDTDTVAVTDPAAGAEAARTAAEHLRRAGAQDYLQLATTNLFQALLQLGDWDAAEEELTRALDSDGLTDGGYLSCCRGWLSALRGD